MDYKSLRNNGRVFKATNNHGIYSIFRRLFSSLIYNTLGDTHAHVRAEDQKIEWYRERLKDIAFDPATIIRHFREKQTKTTLVEFTSSGRGISSFLHVLFSWAREEGQEKALREALDIHLYSYNDELALIRGRHISIKIPDFKKFVCRLSRAEEKLGNYLGRCPLYGRLVPFCDSEAWSGAMKPAEGSPETIQHTIEQMRIVIDKKYAAIFPVLYWAQGKNSLFARTADRSLMALPPSFVKRAFSHDVTPIS